MTFNWCKVKTPAAIEQQAEAGLWVLHMSRWHKLVFFQILLNEAIDGNVA